MSRSKIILRSVITGALVLAATVLARPATADGGRVLAVGDVHGAYKPLTWILREAGLIDARERWIGGSTTLVQLGDFLDRGAGVIEVMDLLMRLQEEAPRHGGRVIVVLGNHEAMNLLGIWRDVNPEIFARLAGPGSAERQQELFEAAAGLYTTLLEEDPLPADFEQRWKAEHPPGFAEYCELLAPDGRYGRWLRSLPSAVKLGDTFFLHAGISPEMELADAGALSERVLEDIAAFDRYRELLLDHGLILPVTDYQDLTATAKGLAANRLARRTYVLASAPDDSAGLDLETARREIRRASKQFLNRQEEWSLTDVYGPLWFRGFTKWKPREGARNVRTLRRKLGVEHFVVGHTPALDRSIHQRFDGAVFLTDTGMLAERYQGGRPAVLERRGERWSAIYLGRRELLAGPTLAGWRGPGGDPLPLDTDEEARDFLLDARVVSTEEVSGARHTYKILLEKDGIRAHAAFRTVEQRKARARLGEEVVLNFHDSYRYEVAAYELSRLLGLRAVPPTVLREIDGEEGSLQLWMERTMTERDRSASATEPPDWPSWYHQVQTMRIFDRLIYNFDRNLGNILIDDDWKLWMIDHTRSFRVSNEVPEIATVTGCERGLWERLRELDEAEVAARLAPHVSARQVKTLMKRRDKVLERIDYLIGEFGEASVLYEGGGHSRGESRYLAEVETFLADLPDSSVMPVEMRGVAATPE